MPVLQALSQASQNALASGRLNGKGLAMIAKAFAELEFYCTGFLTSMDTWASSGETSCYVYLVRPGPLVIYSPYNVERE